MVLLLFSRSIYEDFITFDNILDNSCFVNSRGNLPDYYSGECKESLCGKELCYINNILQEVPLKQLPDGTCVSQNNDLECTPSPDSKSTSSATRSTPAPTATATRSTPAPTATATRFTSAPSATTTRSTPAPSATATRSTSAPTATATRSTSAPTATATTTLGRKLRLCKSTQYLDTTTNQCNSCGNMHVISDNTANTFDAACELKLKLCPQVLCYDHACKLDKPEIKDKVLKYNKCINPDGCRLSCPPKVAKSACRKRNPRRRCVHPDDLTAEYYAYNNDCKLKSTTSNREVDKCRYYCPSIYQRVTKVDGEYICK